MPGCRLARAAAAGQGCRRSPAAVWARGARLSPGRPRPPLISMRLASISSACTFLPPHSSGLTLAALPAGLGRAGPGRGSGAGAAGRAARRAGRRAGAGKSLREGPACFHRALPGGSAGVGAGDSPPWGTGGAGRSGRVPAAWRGREPRGHRRPAGDSSARHDGHRRAPFFVCELAAALQRTAQETLSRGTSWPSERGERAPGKGSFAAASLYALSRGGVGFPLPAVQVPPTSLHILVNSR